MPVWISNGQPIKFTFLLWYLLPRKQLFRLSKVILNKATSWTLYNHKVEKDCGQKLKARYIVKINFNQVVQFVQFEVFVLFSKIHITVIFFVFNGILVVKMFLTPTIKLLQCRSQDVVQELGRPSSLQLTA